MQQRAAIYCRISKDAEQRGLGVQRQERACRALAKRHQVQVVAVYVDNDISAYSGKRRPQYEELVEGIKGHEIDVVLAWHPDRLTRSTKELERLIDLLDASGVEVHTASAGTYDLATASGRMMARVVGATARYQSEQNAERLRSKAEELAATGRPSGGRAPYGYTWEHPEREKGKGNLVPDPTEAQWARRMAEMVLDGWSLLGISRELNALGVPTREGRPWHHSTVRSVITNPSVTGLRVHRREVVGRASWEPVLDRTTYERVQGILKDPARKRQRPANSYVLSGLVFSSAGDKMVGHFDRKRLYATSDRAASVSVWMDADYLEQNIIEVVLDKLNRGDLPSIGDPVDDTTAAELAAIEAEMDELAGQVGTGLTPRQLVQANAGYMKRRNEILARRPARPVRGDLARMLADPAKVAAQWAELSIEQQRQVIGAVLGDNCVVVASIAPGASRKFWRRTAAERITLRPV